MSYTRFPSGIIPKEKLFDSNRYRCRYADFRGGDTIVGKFQEAGWSCFQNKEKNNWNFSTAPHIIAVARSAYVAYSRMCITACQVNPDGTHLVKLPEHTNALDAVRTVEKFLLALSLKGKYKVEVYTPTNVSDEMAYVTILVSVWKNLAGFESEIVQETRLGEILFPFLDQNKIIVHDKETVLAACLEGSIEMVHIRPTPQSDGQISRIRSEPFFTDNRFIFIKTDKASTESPPSRTDDATTDTIRANIESNRPSEVGNAITNHHKSLNLHHRFQENMDAAFVKIKQEPDLGELVHGWEAKKGGGVFLFTKGFWQMVDHNVTVFAHIANTSEVAVNSIILEALFLSGGASLNPNHKELFKRTRTHSMDLSPIEILE